MNHLIASAAAAQPGILSDVKADLQNTADSLGDTAESILAMLPRIAFRLAMALVVLIVGLLLVRLGKMLIRAIANRFGKKSVDAAHRAETRKSILSSIYSYIMFFVIFAVILRIFGVDVGSILAAAGVVGVAVAFGAQTMVKDILSGLFIWGERSMTVGDVVNINDLSGTVESISIRTTTIRNYNGNLITIPNGDIRTMTNMSRSFKRAIVNVPCPYEENQERLVAMVKEEMQIAAKEIQGINTVPDVMSIVSFDTHAVMLQIAVQCPVGEHWRIERDIRTRVKARFDREGIVMPHYTLPKS